MLRLSKPEIDRGELNSVNKVLSDGWLVQGENVQEFEKKISEYLNVEHTVIVSSGTAALHLSLLALGISKNDDVIVPDFTFPATANAAVISGANPILTDVEKETLNISAEEIKSKITNNTKAIIPVHQFGLTANMDEIMEIASQHSLFVVEDAACAFGAKYGEKFCGTIGDIGCFSFHPRKIITTGEGGAVVTNNSELAKKIRIFRNHGLVKADRKIDFIYSGLNYRMTDFQAAIGLRQLEKIDWFLSQRLKLADYYFDNLKTIEDISLPIKKDNKEHIYQTFHVILDEMFDRDKIIESMKTKGIQTNFGAYSLSKLKTFKKKNKGIFINSNNAFAQGLALPLFPSMNKEDIEFVCQGLFESLNEQRGLIES